MSSPNQSKPHGSHFINVIAIALCVVAISYSGVLVYTGTTVGYVELVDSVKPETLDDIALSRFDVSQAVIPLDEIRSGGPPKDGIPALTDPPMILAEAADYLNDSDRVIGVTFNGEASAYPLKILNYHEVVNDQVGEHVVAVTYCPLCDSAVVVNRRNGQQVREFGVSGLLYNNNVLMYDRGVEVASLWSQMMTAGVVGPTARQQLAALPLELTAWSDWRTRYPETKVLSIDTGHTRDYHQSPYDQYFENSRLLMFPVDKMDGRLPTKSPVLGVWTDNAARAYPLSSFDEGSKVVEDELDGRRVSLVYNPDVRSLRVEHADDGVRWVYSFWFAWYAFHPETDIFK